MDETFGVLLARLLDEQGWSQRGFVRRLSVSQASISRAVDGSLPAPSTAQTIITAIRHRLDLGPLMATRLETAYNRELVELCWQELVESPAGSLRGLRRLRWLFDSHRVRKAFRAFLSNRSRSEIQETGSRVESALKARHLRKRLNKEHNWQLANELLAVYRQSVWANVLDLELVSDLFSLAKNLDDGRRLIFPCAATLAFHGHDAEAWDLLNIVRAEGATQSGLIECVCLYYGGPLDARDSLSVLCADAERYPPPYVDSMKAALEALPPRDG